MSKIKMILLGPQDKKDISYALLRVCGLGDTHRRLRRISKKTIEKWGERDVDPLNEQKGNPSDTWMMVSILFCIFFTASDSEHI